MAALVPALPDGHRRPGERRLIRFALTVLLGLAIFALLMAIAYAVGLFS